MDDPKQTGDTIWNPWMGDDASKDATDQETAPKDTSPTDPSIVPPPPPWPVDIKPPLPTNVTDISTNQTQDKPEDTATDLSSGQVVQEQKTEIPLTVEDSNFETNAGDLEQSSDKQEENDAK